jgi:hypothetical protein
MNAFESADNFARYQHIWTLFSKPAAHNIFAVHGSKVHNANMIGYSFL